MLKAPRDSLICLPFLGQGNRSPRDGEPFPCPSRLRFRHDRSTRERAAEMFERGARLQIRRQGPWRSRRAVETGWGSTEDREGRASSPWVEDRQETTSRNQGRRGSAVVDGGISCEARGDGALRHRERDAAEAVVPPVPRGRRRRAHAKPRWVRGSGAAAAPRTREEELEERVRKLEAEVAYLKKSIARRRSSPAARERAVLRSGAFGAFPLPTCWRRRRCPGRPTTTRCRT